MTLITAARKFWREYRIAKLRKYVLELANLRDELRGEILKTKAVIAALEAEQAAPAEGQVIAPQGFEVER